MKVDWKERKRFRRVWLRALRTTTEKQGRGKLGNAADGYCCLGLGCAVNNIPYASERGLLTAHQTFRLGLRPGAVNALATMNDAHGSSFSAIAAAITKNPKKFFIQEPTDAR